jgi:hypothetical protein
MKMEKFHLRSNNSVCAGAFQLLRGRAPAQLRGNIEANPRGIYGKRGIQTGFSDRTLVFSCQHYSAIGPYSYSIYVTEP